MNFKKYPSFMLHTNLTPGPAHTTGGITLPKFSPPLDFRSTVSDPYDLGPTTNIPHPSTFTNNNYTPVPINTQIEPTEVFKNSFNKVIEAIQYLTTSISYRPEIVLFQLVELHQEIKFAASTYQASVPLPRKYFLVNS